MLQLAVNTIDKHSNYHMIDFLLASQKLTSTVRSSISGRVRMGNENNRAEWVLRKRIERTIL